MAARRLRQQRLLGQGRTSVSFKGLRQRRWFYFNRAGSGVINRIYKSIAARSSVDESLVKHISGHSMRVGAAQDLLNSGASLTMIMQRGRWSNADTLMRYIENTNY